MPVVGVAHDARATLDLIRSEAPDVLTLDLQMPGGDGLDLLRELVGEPPVSVVVISGVTRLAAATTLRALELGAVDFILKYTPGAPVSRASLRREIVSKVKIAAAARPDHRPALPQSRWPCRLRRAAASRSAPPCARAARPDTGGVVVIGASTGGPRAIGDLIAQLPADFPMPCVVVQHLPSTFTQAFAAQLARHARAARAGRRDRRSPRSRRGTGGARRDAPDHSLRRPHPSAGAGDPRRLSAVDQPGDDVGGRSVRRRRRRRGAHADRATMAPKD